MKHFLSIIKTIAVCFFSLVLYNCGPAANERDVFKGNFRLSEEARGFIIKDTLASTFKMIDSHDITVQFTNSCVYMGKYLKIRDSNYGTYKEFYLRSYSLLNNYTFDYHLDAYDGLSKLSINSMHYDFASKAVSGYQDQIPDVKFYDEMEVRGVVYHKIIEVDYSASQDKLQNPFPIHTYYSIEKGLIKFIRKDGIFFERI